VIFFEELGGAVMMPRGLIGMARCGGVIFQVCARCSHAFSELAMLLAASWRKKDPSPLDLEVGRFGNYSGGTIRIRRIPNHVRTVWLGNSAAFLFTGSAECRWQRRQEALRWPNSPLEMALSSAVYSSSARNGLRSSWSPCSAAKLMMSSLPEIMTTGSRRSLA
jgi:hypothetical protein